MSFFPRALILALLFTPAVSSADTPAKPAPAETKPAKLTMTELQVVAHYHTVNQTEIELGKAAMKNASSQDVKAYGEMLIKQHTANDHTLKGFVKQTHQIIPPVKPASDVEKQARAEEKATIAKLKTLKGADFDREYLRMMVQGHEMELAGIDARVASVTNTELAALVEANRPMFQHHADAARELQVKQARQPVGSR